MHTHALTHMHRTVAPETYMHMHADVHAHRCRAIPTGTCTHRCDLRCIPGLQNTSEFWAVQTSPILARFPGTPKGELHPTLGMLLLKGAWSATAAGSLPALSPAHVSQAREAMWGPGPGKPEDRLEGAAPTADPALGLTTAVGWVGAAHSVTAKLPVLMVVCGVGAAVPLRPHPHSPPHAQCPLSLPASRLAEKSCCFDLRPSRSPACVMFSLESLPPAPPVEPPPVPSSLRAFLIHSCHPTEPASLAQRLPHPHPRSFLPSLQPWLIPPLGHGVVLETDGGLLGVGRPCNLGEPQFPAARGKHPFPEIQIRCLRCSHYRMSLI